MAHFLYDRRIERRRVRPRSICKETISLNHLLRSIRKTEEYYQLPGDAFARCSADRLAPYRAHRSKAIGYSLTLDGGFGGGKGEVGNIS